MRMKSMVHFFSFRPTMMFDLRIIVVLLPLLLPILAPVERFVSVM